MNKLLLILTLFFIAHFSYAAQISSVIPIFPSECSGFLHTNKTNLKNIFGNYSYQPFDSKSGLPQHSINSVEFSPDGKKIISGYETPGKGYLDGGEIKLWDVSNGKEIFTLVGHSRSVNSLAFSPDGLTAASASTDGTVRLWDVLTGKEIRLLKKVHTGHELAWAVDFTPDGKNLLVGINEEPSLKLLEVTNGEEIQKFHITWNIRRVSVSADGIYALSISTYDSPSLWEISSGKLIRQFRRQSGFWSYLFRSSGSWICGTFSPKAKYVVAGSSDGIIRLWETNSGKEIWAQKAHKDGVNDVAFSPDGNLLLSSGNDGTIKLWDINKSIMIDEIDLTTSKDYGVTLAFSPDGSSFIVGSMRGVILHFSMQN